MQTERISVKVLAMLPNQTEPEHWHPPVGDDPGKEETIRVVSGTVYFYVQGENTFKQGFLVKGKEKCYTLRHEIILKPGDQITFSPAKNTGFRPVTTERSCTVSPAWPGTLLISSRILTL